MARTTQNIVIQGRQAQITTEPTKFANFEEEVKACADWEKIRALIDDPNSRISLEELQDENGKIPLIYDWIREDHFAYAQRVFKKDKIKGCIICLAYSVYFGQAFEFLRTFLNKLRMLDRIQTHFANRGNTAADKLLAEDSKKHKYVQITTAVKACNINSIEYSLIGLAMSLTLKPIRLWNIMLNCNSFEIDTAISTLMEMMQSGRIDYIPSGANTTLDRVLKLSSPKEFDITSPKDTLYGDIMEFMKKLTPSDQFSIEIYVKEKMYAVVQYDKSDEEFEDLLKDVGQPLLLNHNLKSNKSVEYFLYGDHREHLAQSQSSLRTAAHYKNIDVVTIDGRQMLLPSRKLFSTVSKEIFDIQNPRFVVINGLPVIFKKKPNFRDPQRMLHAIDTCFDEDITESNLFVSTSEYQKIFYIFHNNTFFRLSNNQSKLNLRALTTNGNACIKVSIAFNINGRVRMHQLTNDYTKNAKVPKPKPRYAKYAKVNADDIEYCCHLAVIGANTNDIGNYEKFVLGSTDEEGNLHNVCKLTHGFTDRDISDLTNALKLLPWSYSISCCFCVVRFLMHD